MAGFQYRLIMGLYITGLVLGAVLLFATFDIRSWMTWAFIVWVAFFALTIYCWTDEERYAKYEYYLTPVIFGLMFILFALFAVGGIYFAAVSCLGEEPSVSGVFGGLFGGACYGAYAYFDYIFYLRPYFRKDGDDIDA